MYVLNEQDKLVSIISGLLRQKHFQFVDTYKEEAVTTVRALTKQRVIEALAASDCCSDQQAAALEVGGLSLTDRLTLLHNTIQSFTFLLLRVKVYDLVKIFHFYYLFLYIIYYKFLFFNISFHIIYMYNWASKLIFQFFKLTTNVKSSCLLLK